MSSKTLSGAKFSQKTRYEMEKTKIEEQYCGKLTKVQNIGNNTMEGKNKISFG
jgi:hypothetical protein